MHKNWKINCYSQLPVLNQNIFQIFERSKLVNRILIKNIFSPYIQFSAFWKWCRQLIIFSEVNFIKSKMVLSTFIYFDIPFIYFFRKSQSFLDLIFMSSFINVISHISFPFFFYYFSKILCEFGFRMTFTFMANNSKTFEVFFFFVHSLTGNKSFFDGKQISGASFLLSHFFFL